MDGITDIAESVFNVPVRIGEPDKIGGLKDIVKNPAYATGVGLVLFGTTATCRQPETEPAKPGLGPAITRMKKWFKDII
jgi:cell division protein FtsA